MPFQLEWFGKWVMSLGEDPTRDGLVGTPARMSAALEEMLSGYRDDPADHFGVVFNEPGAVDPVRIETTFVSVCEHHVLPFFGKVTIDYHPSNGRIVGLSKVPRGVRVLASRLQTQERLTSEIVNAFYAAVRPRWVKVTIEATHMCVMARGARAESTTTTRAKRP